MAHEHIDLTLFGAIAGRGRAVVHIRQNWADAWTPATHLECFSQQWAVAPTEGKATLAHRYGVVRLPGATVFSVVAPTNITGWYVRITHADAPAWYGIVTDRRNASTGDVIHAAVRRPTGTITYTASTLDVLLRVGAHPDTTFLDFGGPIRRVVPFNARPYFDNRSYADVVIGDDTIPQFAADPNNARGWTAKAALLYLLYHFRPRDAGGVVRVPFLLADAGMLDYFIGFDFDYRGPLLDTINRLIERRRGLGWFVVANDTAATIEVLSWSSAPITMSGWTLPAATRTRSVNTVDSLGTAVTVSTSAVQAYDAVRVIGERRGSVCTLAPADPAPIPYDPATVSPFTALVAAWRPSAKTRYDAGATGDPRYGTDPTANGILHEDVRSTDALSDVYRDLTLNRAWNGRTHSGQGVDVTALPCIPLLDNDGDPLTDPTAVAGLWPTGMLFGESIPLLQGVDYSVEEPVLPKWGGSWLAPFALLLDDATADPPRYALADRCNTQGAAHGDSARGLQWSCTLAVHRHWAGLSLTVANAPQHYLAAPSTVEIDDDENKSMVRDSTRDFVGAALATDGDVIPDGQGRSWYHMLVTVYLIGDERVAVIYPPTPTSGDVLRVLELDAPNHHLDWMPEGTVVGLDGDDIGTLKRAPAGQWVRDHRPRMRDKARLAWLWYGQPRRTLTLSSLVWSTLLAPGDLITTVDATDIYTSITSIRIDWPTSTMHIETGFGELDVMLV